MGGIPGGCGAAHSRTAGGSVRFYVQSNRGKGKGEKGKYFLSLFGRRQRAEVNMEVSQTEYCTVWDQENQSQFLCYSRTINGLSNICLTDAADVWSTEDTSDPEDFIPTLRAACARGQVSVVVHGASAVVHVRSESGDQSVTLSRLEGPRATQEVKGQLFSMADRLTRPQNGSPSASPAKSHRRQPTGFKQQQQQQRNCTPSKAMKKRLPGASLINPGAKRKLQATGVAFEEEDED